MYNELFAPIPNLEQYLDRINMKHPDRLDLEYIDSMILSHQYYVPFENLDIHDDHLPISGLQAGANLF